MLEEENIETIAGYLLDLNVVVTPQALIRLFKASSSGEERACGQLSALCDELYSLLDSKKESISDFLCDQNIWTHNEDKRLPLQDGGLMSRILECLCFELLTQRMERAKATTQTDELSVKLNSLADFFEFFPAERTTPVQVLELVTEKVENIQGETKKGTTETLKFSDAQLKQLEEYNLKLREDYKHRKDNMMERIMSTVEVFLRSKLRTCTQCKKTIFSDEFSVPVVKNRLWKHLSCPKSTSRRKEDDNSLFREAIGKQVDELHQREQDMHLLHISTYDLMASISTLLPNLLQEEKKPIGCLYNTQNVLKAFVMAENPPTKQSSIQKGRQKKTSEKEKKVKPWCKPLPGEEDFPSLPGEDDKPSGGLADEDEDEQEEELGEDVRESEVSRELQTKEVEENDENKVNRGLKKNGNKPAKPKQESEKEETENQELTEVLAKANRKKKDKRMLKKMKKQRKHEDLPEKVTTPEEVVVDLNQRELVEEEPEKEKEKEKKEEKTVLNDIKSKKKGQKMIYTVEAAQESERAEYDEIDDNPWTVKKGKKKK